jgi:acyl dehydratase
MAYDPFKVGEEFDHSRGRTITEHDDTLFSLMSMNQHPVHIDENYASGTQHGQRLVVGPLVIAIVVGMSERIFDGAPTTTLEYRDIRHVNPVFHGDTIYARSRIVARTEGSLTEGVTLTLASEGVNQKGEVVVSLERRIAVRI